MYLGIDRHARHLTASLRGENGDVRLARQGSTEPDRVQAFFTQLPRGRLPDGGRFVAGLSARPRRRVQEAPDRSTSAPPLRSEAATT